MSSSCGRSSPNMQSNMQLIWAISQQPWPLPPAQKYLAKIWPSPPAQKYLAKIWHLPPAQKYLANIWPLLPAQKYLAKIWPLPGPAPRPEVLSEYLALAPRPKVLSENLAPAPRPKVLSEYLPKYFWGRSPLGELFCLHLTTETSWRAIQCLNGNLMASYLCSESLINSSP